MKLFKKVFVLALALTAVLVLSACGGDKVKTLRVGTPKLSGDFISGFGNSAYDRYVRDLVHGYGTLVETEAGEYKWDTKAVLVAEPTTSVDEAGNKTYKFVLQNDLKWNNGEKITAKDYVAFILLYSSKDWLKIATTAAAGIDLVGYKEFHNGPGTQQQKKDANGNPVFDDEGNPVMETVYDPNYSVVEQPFKGVRLIGEYEFWLTIDAENLPYFYEVTSVSAGPIDVETYLPGYDVKDNGQGAFITKVDSSAPTIRETIEKTVNDKDTGQRYNPTVTCGPYEFVSFVNDTATVKRNPNFKTNYEGKTPKIERIEITYVNSEVDVDQVIAGTVDIVNGVIEGAKIEKAKNSENVKLVSYFRNGYGLMAFALYWGPTQYTEVRRAIGFLIDRNVFLTQFLGGYGSLVNGPYGEAQWFYKESKAELDELLINYTLNADKANEELDKSPYKYEADGVTPFDKSKAREDGSYLRHNAQGERLEINHLSASADVGNLINLQLTANAWKVGLKFNYTNTDNFDLLLEHYYYGSTLSEEERVYHSFNLATNFTSAYDPYYSWHSDWSGTTNNPGCLEDEQIDQLVMEMRKLDPTQKEQFRQKFVQFVDRWNELLPNIPLYSNEYFDVYNTRIKGLQSTPVWSWARDICDIEWAD